MKKSLKKFKKIWRRISLKDKVLILIMIILLLQSVINLFVNELNSVEAIDIDMVIHTTTTGIFGYILSSNFLRTPDKPKVDEIKKKIKELEVVEANLQEEILEEEKALEEEEQEQNITMDFTNRQLQIWIAGAICIFSLIVLIIIRDFTDYNGNNGATIVQFKGFISGCVGFLLGHNGSSSKN